MLGWEPAYNFPLVYSFCVDLLEGTMSETEMCTLSFSLKIK